MNPNGDRMPAEASATSGGRLGTELKMAASAVALRSLFLATIFRLKKDSWGHFLTNSDAGSFLSFAKVLYSINPLSSLSLYDARVFPGWPLLFGWALKLGCPDQAMLVIAVGLAALVPVLFYRLTGERSLAWFLVYFPPAWLVATTHPVSEAAYLAVVLAGLLAVKHGGPVRSGAWGGACVVLRAFGVAWLAGFFLGQNWRERRISGTAILTILAGAFPIAGLLLISWKIYGDPLKQLHVYGQPLSQLNIPAGLAAELHNPSGHWGWPFEHLLLTPWRTHVPIWKIAYIYAHVPVVLALVWRAVDFLRGNPRAEAWQIALVLGFLANTALILCTGPYWGFESFDRYFVWGLPGALWLTRPWLNQARWHWLLFPLSVVVSLRSLLGHLPG
jgi:hypothetical protein